MQTFLPYKNFANSIVCLDKRRCWKQCIEAKAIYDNPDMRHPAAYMWRSYREALAQYYNVCLQWCIHHGINTKLRQLDAECSGKYPPWFGYPPFHASHRARLLAKSPYYLQFGWEELWVPRAMWPVDEHGNLLHEIQVWREAQLQAR